MYQTGIDTRHLPPDLQELVDTIISGVVAPSLEDEFEQRLPIAEVALTCEERLPIHEVVTQVKQFIKEAPPPDKLLAEIARTFIRK